jgi:hypothetical protein
MFPTKSNETRCSFCGKGPFKNEAGLHRHISITSSCQKKSQQDFDRYATGIWQGQLFPPRHVEPWRDPSVDRDSSLEPLNIHVENFDVQYEEVHAIVNETQATLPNPLPHSSRPIFTGDTGNKKEAEGRFIEDFDHESLAGAAWGKAVPLFESLLLKQEETGSRWDPFVDEEEWELAEWLIDNVGQKRTDTFLKMRIVFLFLHLRKSTSQ